jgi:DtxR family Mn-dependent transcriptional regulator
MMMRRRRGMRGLSEERLEELLELIWTLKEEGTEGLNQVISMSGDTAPALVLRGLEEKGHIEIKDGEIHLSRKGEKEAKEVVRRHRLAECLLHEVFELPVDDVEEEACKFEHILSPAVTESICTFLGHPPMCPHGKPIPPGPCCAKFTKEIKPLVIPLGELGVGESGRIVFISTKRHMRLDRLGALGIVPGSVVRMHQKIPSYILEIGESTVALDDEVIRDIYVKRV